MGRRVSKPKNPPPPSETTASKKAAAASKSKDPPPLPNRKGKGKGLGVVRKEDEGTEDLALDRRKSARIRGEGPEELLIDEGAKKPAAKEPSIDDEAKKPAAKETSMEEEPKEPAAKETSIEEPKEPVVKESSINEEAKKPAAKEPSIEEPKEPAAKEPSIEEPKEPVAKEPSIEEPKEPAAKEPELRANGDKVTKTKKSVATKTKTTVTTKQSVTASGDKDTTAGTVENSTASTAKAIFQKSVQWLRGTEQPNDATGGEDMTNGTARNYVASTAKALSQVTVGFLFAFWSVGVFFSLLALFKVAKFFGVISHEMVLAFTLVQVCCMAANWYVPRKDNATDPDSADSSTKVTKSVAAQTKSNDSVNSKKAKSRAGGDAESTGGAKKDKSKASGDADVSFGQAKKGETRSSAASAHEPLHPPFPRRKEVQGEGNASIAPTNTRVDDNPVGQAKQNQKVYNNRIVVAAVLFGFVMFSAAIYFCPFWPQASSNAMFAEYAFMNSAEHTYMNSAEQMLPIHASTVDSVRPVAPVGAPFSLPDPVGSPINSPYPVGSPTVTDPDLPPVVNPVRPPIDNARAYTYADRPSFARGRPEAAAGQTSIGRATALDGGVAMSSAITALIMALVTFCGSVWFLGHAWRERRLWKVFGFAIGAVGSFVYILKFSFAVYNLYSDFWALLPALLPILLCILITPTMYIAEHATAPPPEQQMQQQLNTTSATLAMMAQNIVNTNTEMGNLRRAIPSMFRRAIAHINLAVEESDEESD